jgi:hypothetical protein
MHMLGRRLRAVDATSVHEPGTTGTDWKPSVVTSKLAIEGHLKTGHRAASQNMSCFYRVWGGRGKDPGADQREAVRTSPFVGLGFFIIEGFCLFLVCADAI